MKPRTLQRIRSAHRWLGVFFAPLVVFFSLTGTLQLLGVDDWSMPEWAHSLYESLEDGHQDQRLRRGTALRSAATWLTAALGVALAATTLLGVVLGWRLMPPRRRWVLWATLAAGVVVPLVLFLI